MSDDEGYTPSGGGGGAGEGNMGKSMEGDVNSFLLMEDVIDKLHILDYEIKFCKQQKNGLKPIPRTYFALPASNPNEQFYYFTSLVAWLMRLCGHHFSPPGQFDDPNATSATLVDELKKMGFVTDFVPGKLKQGFGVAICTVLNHLLDLALAAIRFTFKQPTLTSAEQDDVAVSSEMVGDAVDEAIQEVEENEDDEKYSIEGEEKAAIAVHESKVDPAQWRLEVERVTPSLKVHVTVDHKDWRTHLEQMQEYHQTVSSYATSSMGGLGKLTTDIDQTLEKISTREKLINTQYETLLREYKATQEAFLACQDKYRRSSDNVTNLTAELDDLSRKLEEVENQKNSRSKDMTDATPVVNLKKAMSKLKEEIIQMEVRIGVIQHTLLQAKFRNLSHGTFNTSEKSLNTKALGITVEYE